MSNTFDFEAFCKKCQLTHRNAGFRGQKLRHPYGTVQQLPPDSCHRTDLSIHIQLLQERSLFHSEYYFKALYMMLITSALLMVFFGENLLRSVAPMIPLT